MTTQGAMTTSDGLSALSLFSLLKRAVIVLNYRLATTHAAAAADESVES